MRNITQKILEYYLVDQDPHSSPLLRIKGTSSTPDEYDEVVIDEVPYQVVSRMIEYVKGSDSEITEIIKLTLDPIPEYFEDESERMLVHYKCFNVSKSTNITDPGVIMQIKEAINPE
ncbi:hypothetical protein LIS04_15 [Listeria phage LIS04]|nr:hypothetical protein LIS04_15 [Listeria phage LIS04]